MSIPPTASQTITDAVTSWAGVTAAMGRRGELAFRAGGTEIGHLHGNTAAHFYFFDERQWAELKRQRRIGPHPVFPDRERLAARRIESDGDVEDVIAMMRLNYDWLSRRTTPGGAAA